MSNIKLSNFNTTKTTTTSNVRVTNEDIIQFVSNAFETFKQARNIVEDTWVEAWSLYLGTPQAVDAQRSQALKTVGDVNVNWRHKINTGKAYEMVETVHGYLMAATFPNNEWFSVEPSAPGYARLSRVVRKYLANKFEQANFKAHYASFLRQLLITGTSVIALPWRYESKPCRKKVVVKKLNFDPLTETEYESSTIEEVEEERVVQNNPDFIIIDAFDVWVDSAVNDPNEGAFIRRLEKTRAEVMSLTKEGHYDLISLQDVENAAAGDRHKNADKEEVEYYQNMSNTTNEHSMGDVLELIEFWGDVHTDGITFHDVCVTMMGNQLLKFEANPFWAGRPFHIATCTPLTQSPYSMGLLQPNLGLLHQLNIITNQRLDNLELSTDTMLLVRQDGVLNPEDLGIAPGKVLFVNDPAAIQAFALPNTTQITYTEASVLEQSIDKNAGTGALISANAARSGERVTAAEIAAVRDAGGNRLSGLQSHVEATTLKPILNKVYRNAQQFVSDDELVRVTGDETGEYDYFNVGAEQLSYDFKLKPVGSEHVIDRNKYISDRLQFIQSVAQVPQMAELVNYEALLFDIVQHFGFDDPESYLVQKQEQTLPSVTQGSLMNQGEEQALVDQAAQVGGVPMQQAMEASIKADGGQAAIKAMTGVDTNPMVTQMEEQLTLPQQ